MFKRIKNLLELSKYVPQPGPTPDSATLTKPFVPNKKPAKIINMEALEHFPEENHDKTI